MAREVRSYMIAPQQIIRVKLGKSVDPSRRRSTLQTGACQNLLLLAESKEIKENDLHNRFKQYQAKEGGTEFFDLPLDVFLGLYLEFYESNSEIKTTSRPQEEKPFSFEWERVSPEASRRGRTDIYTLAQLQEIARHLKINPTGMNKKRLAEEILLHRPPPQVVPIKLERDEPQSLLARILKVFT